MKLVQMLVFSFVVSFLLFSEAIAYVGPGAGLSAIGSFLALVVAVVAAILGFLWYPIKRLLKGRKQTLKNDKEI